MCRMSVVKRYAKRRHKENLKKRAVDKSEPLTELIVMMEE